MIRKFKKTIFTLFAVLQIVIAFGQNTGFDNRALNTFLKAENAFANEDYSTALSMYNDVLKIDSVFDPAMFQLARVYLVRNQTNEALNWTEKAYKLDQKNKMYALLLVDLYKHFNKFDEAIAVYKNLLSEDKTNTEYLEDLAQVYKITKNTTAAIAIYDQIEKLEGINEHLSFLKRDLYLNSGNFDKAVLEMIKLSDHFPDNSQYYSMIAEMYMGNKQPDKAFFFYQKVLDINPSDPYIRITLADYYQQKGDIDLAFENLEKGYANPKLDLDTKTQLLMGILQMKDIPADRIRTESLKLANTMAKVHAKQPGAHALYADILYNDSLFSEAVNEYKEVIKLDSSHYAVWEKLLFSLNSSAQNQEITAISQRAINLFPKEPIPYLFNAIGHLVADSVQMAIHSLETGLPLSQNPNLSEQFLMYLGDAYYQNKQSEKAFEAYDKCLKINPSNTFVLNNYAYYLALRKEKLDKAKTMAFTAISLSPEPTNQDTYGWVLYQLGDYEEALKHISLAVDGQEKPSAEVLDHMGDVYFRLGEDKKARKFWKEAQKSGLDTDELKHKISNGL